MFLRAYRRNDKRNLQQLFFEVVHNIGHPGYSAGDLDRWAPVVPDRETWNKLDEQQCYVVELNKNIVGFGSLNILGVLEWLYVHPIHQGKGIAKALVRQIERQVRKQNRQSITACATINALGFFKSIGYTPAEAIPHTVNHPVDNVWLKKQLEQDNNP